MADEKYTIPDNPQYRISDIRKLQDTDPASATKTFNPVIEPILESVEYLNRHKAENDLKLYKAEISDTDWTYNGTYYTVTVPCVSVNDGSSIPSDYMLSAPMCLRDLNPTLNSRYLDSLNLINSAIIRVLSSGKIEIHVTSQPTSYMELYFYGKKESDIRWSNSSFILPGGDPTVKTTAENANSTATEALSTANSALSKANAAQTSADNANTAANTAQTTANTANTKANAALPKSGGAMTGTLSDANSAQVRNIIASTTDLTAGTSSLTTGTVYLVYE